MQTKAGITLNYAICTDHMMTSSNGNIFRVTGPLCGEFTGPGEFPTQRPVTRSFDVFFDLCLNKRLSKQPWGWWFETLSWSLWRHCNERGLELGFQAVDHHTGWNLQSRNRPCFRRGHFRSYHLVWCRPPHLQESQVGTSGGSGLASWPTETKHVEKTWASVMHAWVTAMMMWWTAGTTGSKGVDPTKDVGWDCLTCDMQSCAVMTRSHFHKILNFATPQFNSTC